MNLDKVGENRQNDGMTNERIIPMAEDLTDEDVARLLAEAEADRDDDHDA